MTQLAVICDSDGSRLAAVGAQYPSATQTSLPETVFSAADVDAVCIVTPLASHYSLVKAALQAGKHVLVEKPFVSRVEEAEELMALARERGLILMLDHVFLFSPAVRRLVQAARGGELGDLQYIDSVRINLGLVQPDVNVLWDLAAHDLSIMDDLVGRLPLSVSAYGAAHQGHELVDVAYLHLDYGDGLISAVHVNWLSPVKIRQFLVGGSRRSALYNELDPSERLKIYDRGVDSLPDPERVRRIAVSYRSGDVIAPALDPTEPLRAMIEHFADCVTNHETPICGADQGLRIVRILAAADESLVKGGVSIDVADSWSGR
jgi:predicted dehydrogenase